MDLTFSGGGFMGSYYFGVVDCWNKYIPRERVNRVAGASAGSLIAAYYLLGLPMETCLNEVIRLMEDVRSRTLGVFDRSNQIVDILPRVLDNMFPDDAHKIVSGRLHVCMTRLKDMKKVIVSEFESKKDLIDALNCSCFIPVWSGNHVSTYKGVKHIDGGVKDNLPVFDENTIRICCFAGQTDISPYDRSQKELLSSNILNTPLYFTVANLKRGAMALWPPPVSATLDMLERGFQDAKSFILDNDLIQCERCYLRFRATAESGCLFSLPNPTISPAATPALGRRQQQPEHEQAEPSTTASETDSGCHTEHLPATTGDVEGLAAKDKRSHSPDSIDGSQTVAEQPAVPNILINNHQQELANQENSTPVAPAAKLTNSGRQAKKKSRFSIDAGLPSSTSSSVNTLRERRKSQAQLMLGAQLTNQLSVMQDSFKRAPSDLPSCPPSPNINRHCNECLRLRQEARNDQLEHTIRKVAENYLAADSSKGSDAGGGGKKIRRKLSSPLRWIRTQFKPSYSYEFTTNANDAAAQIDGSAIALPMEATRHISRR